MLLEIKTELLVLFFLLALTIATCSGCSGLSERNRNTGPAGSSKDRRESSDTLKINERLSQRVAAADLIMWCEITEVEYYGALSYWDIQSEFNPYYPYWHKAEFEVKEILKGKLDSGMEAKELVFPKSGEKAWRERPKLKKGDRGILLLRIKALKINPFNGPYSTRISVYWLEEKTDFQPEHKLQLIKQIILKQQAGQR